MSKKNGKEKQPPQVRSQITITLFEDGQIQVNGPLNDRILFYGMLEVARDSVLMRAGREGERVQAAEQVKGSLPWWRKVFAGKGANAVAQPEPNFSSGPTADEVASPLLPGVEVTTIDGKVEVLR